MEFFLSLAFLHIESYLILSNLMTLFPFMVICFNCVWIISHLEYEFMGCLEMMLTYYSLNISLNHPVIKVEWPVYVF